MKKILALLAFLPLLVQGQIFNPVSWEFSHEWKDNETVILHFDAKIEKGWHVYAIGELTDDGPIPTTFYFEDNEAFKRVGDVKQGELHTAVDPMFGMEVDYFEDKASFTQTIKVTGALPAHFKGELEFSTCDNERCLPPELVAFDFNIQKNNTNSATESTDAEQGSVTPPNTQEESQIFNPVEWQFKAEKLEGNTYKVAAKATIGEGWHLYSLTLPSEDGPFPTGVRIEENEQVKITSPVSEPEPITAYDPNFMMDLRYHEKEVTFTAEVEVLDASSTILGELDYMVCNEERCLPPEYINFNIPLDGNWVGPATAVEESNDQNEQTDRLKIAGLDLDNPVKDCQIAGEITQEKKTYWNIFILGFIGGLLALLTPCVFPMIPLTVSFFTKGGKDKSGAWQSLLYGGFILLIYLILSSPFHLMDSVDPEILNTISTNMWLNLFFFVIFIVFAISFFGYFEITVPSRFTNKIDGASNVGGLVGTFFMALTLALVSFSCTGPILGSLLAGSLSSDGGAWQLTAGMGGFGLALALPFALFAAFPAWLQSLPKSGGWLNTVKVVLGFVELALAIKFFSNADLVEGWHSMTVELFIGLWIVIGLGLFLYTIGVIKFPHDSPIKKRFTFFRMTSATLILAFVVYLASGFRYNEKTDTFTTLSLLSGLAPPVGYSWIHPKKCPIDLDCFNDYDKAIELAKETNKPVLIDFTGKACVNCRKMEENVWPKDGVHELLKEQFVLVSLYVDDRKPLAEEDQFTYELNGKKKKIRTVGDKWATFETVNFENNSQPLYVIVSPDGTLMNNPVGYTPDVNTYQQFLECGLDAYNESK